MTTGLTSFWLRAEQDEKGLGLVEPTGRELTKGELLAASNQAVHGLRALGLSKGDTFAVVMPNCAAGVELALASGQGGFYVTPVNFHLTAPEVEFILKDSMSKVVVCHEKVADIVRKALATSDIPPRNRFVVGKAEGFRPYDELKAGQPTTRPETRVGGFAMTYTSGTTGRPRGVRRPLFDVDADQLATGLAGFPKLFGIPDAGVHLVVAPLYHTAVMNFCIQSLHLGHTIVLMDKWTPEKTFELVEKYHVTTTHMVPTMFVRMLAVDEAERKKRDLSSFTHVIHSAAPCPVAVKHQMLAWLGPVIFEYYAASEGGGTTATPQDWLKKPGTVGKPWPISTIRILDEQNQPLPPKTPGTVWIKMGDHKFEYHGDKEKTQKAWNEGFFTVGDAGYLDEDGFLFLVDRKADMIISGGVNIYPAEIESELIGHPDVADCAVFGIPNTDWGEEVKAVVQPREGLTGDDALRTSINAYLEERLAKYKRPKTIDFMAQLPRDPNGKLYKRRLRDPYWEGRERQI